MVNIGKVTKESGRWSPMGKNGMSQAGNHLLMTLLGILMRIPRILLLLLLLNLTTNFLFFSYYTLFFILFPLYPMLDNFNKKLILRKDILISICLCPL
jgi:hypothetical protein